MGLRLGSRLLWLHLTRIVVSLAASLSLNEVTDNRIDTESIIVVLAGVSVLAVALPLRWPLWVRILSLSVLSLNISAMLYYQIYKLYPDPLLYISLIVRPITNFYFVTFVVVYSIFVIFSKLLMERGYISSHKPQSR